MKFFRDWRSKIIDRKKALFQDWRSKIVNWKKKPFKTGGLGLKIRKEILETIDWMIRSNAIDYLLRLTLMHNAFHRLLGQSTVRSQLDQPGKAEE